eukprot:TRINITY_DN5268_c0_g1_i1.p9 TRINITY_DN5268_c0_g1~~TRINITY_DN5268_c0_g1_i1.p9  ORF type:complete len:199 (-),score=-8.08 TRINITY_DN5268_c0_g1_i1:3028-3624(-)
MSCKGKRCLEQDSLLPLQKAHHQNYKYVRFFLYVVYIILKFSKWYMYYCSIHTTVLYVNLQSKKKNTLMQITVLCKYFLLSQISTMKYGLLRHRKHSQFHGCLAKDERIYTCKYLQNLFVHHHHNTVEPQLSEAPQIFCWDNGKDFSKKSAEICVFQGVANTRGPNYLQGAFKALLWIEQFQKCSIRHCLQIIPGIIF